MLQRIFLFKPWIQHPMSEQNVRRLTTVQRLPGSETVVLPNAIDDHRVITVRVRSQPRNESRAESIVKAGGTQRIYPKWRLLQKGCSRGIERHDLHVMAVMF